MNDQLYADDELVAAANLEKALEKTKRIDEIYEHDSMHNNGCTYSGDKGYIVSIGDDELKIQDRVLGLLLKSEKDVFIFSVELNLKLMLR